MLPISFTALLVGKQGSGKSSLISLLLKNKNCFYKKFDLVLFLAPYSIADLDLKDDRLHSNLSPEWVYEQIEINRLIKPINNCLVIIDDLISSIKDSHQNPSIVDFFFNRRKIVKDCEISILCTTQKYTMYPARFRSSLNFIIFFNIPPDDYKFLSKEQIFNPAPHLTHRLDLHFKKPHNFVYLRLDPYALYLNFKERL